MKIRSLCSVLAPIVVLLAMSSPGRADVIFSNFGAMDSFDITSTYVVSTPTSSIGFFQDIGVSFTVTGSDFVFTSAELALRAC